MEKVAEKEAANSTVLDNLPPSFQKFLKENGVDIALFYDTKKIEQLPRYLRFNPLKKISIEEVQVELGVPLTHVEWIPNIYSIPADTKISHTQAYKNGEIYGIDLSSCAVVLALDPQSNEHILDLCCSPGSKLCYIADIMKSGSPSAVGSLTGVDINEHRLNVCRSLVNKYSHSDIVKLYCEDGTTFKKLPDQKEFYDRILVDAECTHDGSVKHLLKFTQTSEESLPVTKAEKDEVKGNVSNNDKKEEKQLSNKEKKRRAKQKLDNFEALQKKKMKINNEWTFENFEDRVLNEEKLKNITSLQKSLVVNAFSLLKPKGVLVYSTCSFIKAQNEDVVRYVMEECPETKGKVEVIDVFHSDISGKIPFRQGFWPKTVRFDPNTSNTSGMFIAKFQKL